MTRRKDIPEKRALTINEAAEYACVSRSTVENWLNSGLLPFEDLPSGRSDAKYKFKRIRKTDLDEFLDRHRRCARKPENVRDIPAGVFLMPKTA